ncbi:MAG: hypothetical protein MUC51_13045, partial [Anaerolineae bacterium]|nr:hypothetical protein [Anaerolineae bacterium]
MGVSTAYHLVSRGCR